MRIAILALLVGCTVGSGAPSRPVHVEPPSWPTLLPTGASYNSRVVALRTTLGRAAIRLEMRGAIETIHTSNCTNTSARSEQAGCARCDLADESDQLEETALDALRVAFDRYPASFLVASKIESVALCKHIEYEDIVREFGTSGTVDYKQRRLFISTEPFIGRVYDTAGDFTVEDIVHHELFHLIEYVHMRSEMSDPEWRLENPIGFEYYDGAVKDARRAGFVNPYAATNEIEDRASTYQYLMARPAELCELGRADPAIRAKTKQIWSRVAKVDGDAWLRARAKCGER